MTWLRELLKVMTPNIVEAFQRMIADGLQSLYEKALETDNKWDDVGVEVMAKVFGVALTVPEPPSTAQPPE